MNTRLSDWKSLQERILGPYGLWVPIACIYLFVSLSRIDDGGTNGRARFATLRAMSYDHSFRIDSYHDWTEDWTRTPDGHYYANKAPGPTLMGFPLFWVLDQALRPLQESLRDEQGRAQAPRGIQKVALSTVFQVLPFLLFSLLALRSAYQTQLPREEYLLCLIAILFGNTAAVMMSSYMGDSFAAMALMGFAYFYLERRFSLASFCFGWVVLSEYSAALLVLPFLWILLPEMRERGWKSICKDVAIGASLPAFLWCWYHTICFGGPLTLPFKYDVGSVVSKVASDDVASLWGKISFLPKPHLFYELILGPTRGILFTQPWLLLAVALPFLLPCQNIRLQRLFRFSAISLFLLLWVNAGYPGWHGGGNPGPRYLAAALPLFGLFIPCFYARLPKSARYLFIAALVVSVVLRALVYATWMLPPPIPLWPYYLAAIQSTKEWLMLGLFTLAMGCGLFFYFRKARVA